MQFIREDLIKTCTSLYRQGLACSTGGNVSARVDNMIYITGTNTSLGRLEVKDIIACGLDGHPLEPGKPSKEIDLHVAIYSVRPEVGAIVHVHSPFGLMLGMFEDPSFC